MHNVIAFANGKGGVGKTSLTANFAGLAANAGWRVLAVDLDPQGNLGSDLGYDQADNGDDGRELLDSIVNRRVPQPIKEIRPNLDVTSLLPFINFFDRKSRKSSESRGPTCNETADLKNGLSGSEKISIILLRMLPLKSSGYLYFSDYIGV